MSTLEKLMYLSGVSAEYFDYSGTQRLVSWEQRVDALRVSGYPVDDECALATRVSEIDAQPWTQLLRPFNVVAHANPSVMVQVSPDQLEAEIKWSLPDYQLSGIWQPANAPEVGEYYIDGLRYSARQLPLPVLELGYTQLQVTLGDVVCCAELAVCPERAQALTPTEKMWGISCQLYTLRSARNWGIGDFTDLRELLRLAAAQGASMIGLNPLHALLSDRDDTPSPYSPSDRRRLNPLYLDVERVARELSSDSAMRRIASAEVQSQLRALREVDLVDYEKVAKLKYSLLETVFEDFEQQPLAAAHARFEDFIALNGASLLDFSRYEAAHNQHARRFRDHVRFYQYLQWLATEQLQACQALALDLGMSIGLVGDLAVGAVAAGCEVTSNPGLYLSEVKIGAPPDPFSEHGQNWGLPAPDPVAMRHDCFRHFRALLRANMQHVGALRIDHVMALMRLWWCLPGDGKDPRDGLYVYYPMDELLALVCLESQLNQCVIIGEDLGVVPFEMRDAMRARSILSNTIFYFEQELDGYFRLPDRHQYDALLMVTNHDVPTLADWWRQQDLARRHELTLLSHAAYHHEMAQRTLDKQRLLSWLAHIDHLPRSWKVDDTSRNFDFLLCEAIHRGCAGGASRLVMVQLEDMQLGIAPVNIPGTHREYPNWRRKQNLDTQDLLSSDPAVRIVHAVNEERTL